MLFSTGTFSNTDVVAFQYDIEPEDVNEQYEFFIGTSAGDSGNDTLGFVFLAVAGASNTSGPTTYSDGNPIFKQALYDVDYVVSLQDDMTEKEYKIHQTILRVNSYAAPVGSQLSLYYLAKTVQNDAAGFVSRVFYYSPDSNKIIDITVAQQSKDSKPSLPTERRLQRVADKGKSNRAMRKQKLLLNTAHPSQARRCKKDEEVN